MNIAPPPGMALRILRFPLVLMLVEFFGIAFFASLASAIARKTVYAKDAPGQTLGALLVAAATIGAYVTLRNMLEGHKGETEFGLKGSATELGGGLIFGAALFASMTGIVALLGGFEITGTRFPGQIWAMLAMAAVSGVTEETLFRGVAFRHLETMLGSWAALFITSAFFGVAHIFNPGATLFSSFAIALEAGMLLGGAYMLTRRLWLAVGIHAAWNFTQGWVFSVPVSGGAAPIGFLVSQRSGPDWLTGGTFGLEASVIAMLVATAAGLVMLVLAVRKGQVVPPRWKRI